MLTTGGLTVVAAVIPERVHQATRPQRLPFDIRDAIPGAENDNECIQCIYDTINRMVVLIGDIPFRDLFRLPLAELIPMIFPRIQEAAGLGLIASQAEVEALVEQLHDMGGSLLIEELFVRSRSQIPFEVLEVLIQLRRNGIRIPLPISRGRDAAMRLVAVRQLLEVAADLTFTDLFIRTRQDTPQSVIEAVHSARAVGLFSWWQNDRCCDQGGGEVPSTDTCVDQDGMWCNLPPPSHSFCSISSDTCPGDTPGEPG